MKIKKELIARNIAGDVILVPVGKAVYENNGLFALSELGAFIWQRLPEAVDQEEILRDVLRVYEVSEEQARQDLEEFLQQLRKMEII